MGFVSLLSNVWQTDRWTGSLTDNGDVKVAGDTPSETPLWLLSQPLVLTPIKRGSFNSPSSFPAMAETVVLAQELFVDRKRTKNHTGWKDVFFFFLLTAVHSVFVSLDIYARAQLSQSDCVLSAFLFGKLVSNDLVWEPVSSLGLCDGESWGNGERIRSEVVERRGRELWNLIRICFELIN